MDLDLYTVERTIFLRNFFDIHNNCCDLLVKKRLQFIVDHILLFLSNEMHENRAKLRYNVLTTTYFYNIFYNIPIEPKAPFQ